MAGLVPTSLRDIGFWCEIIYFVEQGNVDDQMCENPNGPWHGAISMHEGPKGLKMPGTPRYETAELGFHMQIHAKGCNRNGPLYSLRPPHRANPTPLAPDALPTFSPHGAKKMNRSPGI